MKYKSDAKCCVMCGRTGTGRTLSEDGHSYCINCYDLMNNFCKTVLDCSDVNNPNADNKFWPGHNCYFTNCTECIKNNIKMFKMLRIP